MFRENWEESFPEQEPQKQSTSVADNDIVTELRDWADIIDRTSSSGLATVTMVSGAVHREAADEIERLRELCRTYFDNEHELLNEIERLNKIINDAPPKGFVVRETSNSTYTVTTTEF